MIRIRLPRRWAQAVVLVAAAGAGLSLFGSSVLRADPATCTSDCYGSATYGSCNDDTWWDRTCDYCRDRTDRFRTWRRKWYWKNNDRHISTMYPETSPFCSPTYGYYQTCWRPFPYECPRCPQYNVNPGVTPTYPPSGGPAMDLTPATDAAQPASAPGAQQPYFPEPPAPPPSELPVPPETGTSLPLAPPERFDSYSETAQPLGFRSLPPVQEVFRDDGWTPRNQRLVRIGFERVD